MTTFVDAIQLDVPCDPGWYAAVLQKMIRQKDSLKEKVRKAANFFISRTRIIVFWIWKVVFSVCMQSVSSSYTKC